MLSAGVAFRQQFWPISVSVKRLLDRSRASIPSGPGIPLRIESAAFESGARRTSAGGMPAVLSRGSAISHRKGRSDERCGHEQKAPHQRYLSSSPLEDEPPEDQDGVVPAEGLGEAQLGPAGAGAG